MVCKIVRSPELILEVNVAAKDCVAKRRAKNLTEDSDTAILS